MNSPLEGIENADQLLGLPYFEFLACLGDSPLHPGGDESTCELLEVAELTKGDRVLEVGCGTGWTTRLLLAAGADVTIVENCPRMLLAARRSIHRAGLRMPRCVAADAEDLSPLAGEHFDLILCQSVFGFIRDRQRALDECLRRLRVPTGRIGIVDFYYVSVPAARLREKLANIVGTKIEPLRESDWKKLFSQVPLVYWNTHALSGRVISLEQKTAEIKVGLTDSGLMAEIPWADEGTFAEMAKRWIGWNDVFEENRRLMRSVVALWGSPAETGS